MTTAQHKHNMRSYYTTHTGDSYKTHRDSYHDTHRDSYHDTENNHIWEEFWQAHYSNFPTKIICSYLSNRSLFMLPIGIIMTINRGMDTICNYAILSTEHSNISFYYSQRFYILYAIAHPINNVSHIPCHHYTLQLCYNTSNSDSTLPYCVLVRIRCFYLNVMMQW